jgi:hypothetical protein
LPHRYSLPFASSLVAVLAATSVLAGCGASSALDLPFGRSPRDPLMAAGARDIGTGDLSGVVTDSSSGQPVVGAVVFATTDTAPGAPVSNFSAVTDADGRFLLTDVPAGARVIEARMLGFTRERHVTMVRRGAVDSLALELRSGDALHQQQLETLRIPTAATPCRPSDVSAAWITGALADALAVPAPGTAPAGVKLPAATAERIRLVLKPALCQRALAAWQKNSGNANPFAQVYLFDLGGDGWALFDPAQALGNSTAIVPVLDRDFKVIATLAF